VTRIYKDLFPDAPPPRLVSRYPGPGIRVHAQKEKVDFELSNGEEIIGVLRRSYRDYDVLLAWEELLKKVAYPSANVSKGKCSVDGGDIFCEFVLSDLDFMPGRPKISGVRVHGFADDLEITTVHHWDVEGDTLVVSGGS